jgi:hypothetical protein
MTACGLGLTGPEETQVSGCYENGSEPSDPMKCVAEDLSAS